MFELRVATEIAASADDVWSVLTDLPRFGDWNPFIRAARGPIAPGATVHVSPRTRLGLRLAFAPTIIACEPPHLLRWQGHFVSPALARGDHAFAIEALGPGRARLEQRMTFAGPLPRLFAPLIVREARHGFAQMNEALRRRAELRATARAAARAAAAPAPAATPATPATPAAPADDRAAPARGGTP